MFDYMFSDSVFEIFCKWAGLVADSSSTGDLGTAPIGLGTAPIG